jgi:hypothetical protein
MSLNIIFKGSNGIRNPRRQTAASLSQLDLYITNVPNPAVSPLPNDPYAAAVIQSNGDSVGNAIPKSNPLPPGLSA